MSGNDQELSVPMLRYRSGLEIEVRDSYYELFDLASGNVIEDYERECDAIDALIAVVSKHGPQAIETFALTHVEGGQPVLIAMEEELVLRVDQEMRRLVPHRRTS
jgi:hypothetical protein